LLAPEGRFAFDLVAPRYDFLAEATGHGSPLGVDTDQAAPDQGVKRFPRSYTDAYDPASQTLRSTNRYEIFFEDGRVEHRIIDPTGTSTSRRSSSCCSRRAACRWWRGTAITTTPP
jgi:hypothetical protein